MHKQTAHPSNCPFTFFQSHPKIMGVRKKSKLQWDWQSKEVRADASWYPLSKGIANFNCFIDKESYKSIFSDFLSSHLHMIAYHLRPHAIDCYPHLPTAKSDKSLLSLIAAKNLQHLAWARRRQTFAGGTLSPEHQTVITDISLSYIKQRTYMATSLLIGLCLCLQAASKSLVIDS